MTFVPLMLAKPFVAATEMIASVSPSTSESFTKTGIVTVTFFGALAESFTATGGRFVTLMLMRAVFVPPNPSVMV